MLSFVCSARKKNSKSGQVDPHFYLPCQTFLLALPDIVLTLIYINYFELECMGSPPYSMLNGVLSMDSVYLLCVFLVILIIVVPFLGICGLLWDCRSTAHCSQHI